MIKLLTTGTLDNGRSVYVLVGQGNPISAGLSDKIRVAQFDENSERLYVQENGGGRTATVLHGTEGFVPLDDSAHEYVVSYFSLALTDTTGAARWEGERDKTEKRKTERERERELPRR